MLVNCGICIREKKSDECEVIELTAQEKRELTDRGVQPAPKYYYCKPCWRIMKSEHAPDLMANQAEHQLRTAGLSKEVAKKLAGDYKARLTKVKEKKNATKTR